MNKMQLLKYLLLTFFTFSMYSAYSTKRYWVGNGTNKNWNSTSNWSSISGGLGGSSVPGSNDSVYLDANGIGQCLINATVSVKRLEMGAGYSDTLKQSSYSITVGTGGMVLSGGVFWGGSTTITDQGGFTLQGTNFHSTAARLSIQGAYNFTSGTFLHNNGEVFYSGTFNITGSTTFYKCTFSGAAQTLSISSGTVLTINNMLTVTGCIINGGAINSNGDITQNGTNTGYAGTTTINIVGTGDQIINGQSSSSLYIHGWLPNIKINKSSGTLYLKDYIVVKGTWEYVAGIVDATTYSSTLSFPAGAKNYIIGKHSLNNLIIGTSGGGVDSLFVNIGDTLKLTGYLKTAGNGATAITGYIEVKGDIFVDNASPSNYGGAGTLILNGVGNQTIAGRVTLGQGRLCNIKINKPSGTLYFKDYIPIKGNWTYLQGTCDFTTYNNTIVFTDSPIGRTISGNQTFNNVAFYAPSYCYINTPTNDTMTINGTLYYEGSSIVKVESGVVRAKGDITLNNTSNNTVSVGSGLLLICGSNNQIFTGSITEGNSRLSDIKIIKTGGILTLKNIISVQGNWNYVSGTIDAAAFNSTVAFVANTTSTVARTIQGTLSLHNVSLNGTTYTSYNNIPLTDTLTVEGILKIDGIGSTNIGTGTVKVKGDLLNTNTNTGVLGTGLLLFCGTGNQTLTGTNTTLQGKLCNITIQKPSGVLTLKNFISLADNANWKLLNGNVDVTSFSSTVVFARGAHTIQGKQSFNNVSFNSVNLSSTYTLASGDTITVNGELKIEGTQSVSINTGLIDAKGNVTITNTSTGATSSSATIRICGLTNQTFTGSGTVLAGKVCNVLIDKPSDTLNLNSIITFLGSWTYLNGIVASNSSTVVSSGSSSISPTNGSNFMLFNNLRVYNSTLLLNSMLALKGDLTISSGATLNGNSQTIYLGGNWDNTGTFSYSGTKVVFAGSASNGKSHQKIIKPSGGPAIFYNFELNKPDGSLYLNCPTQVNFRLFLKKGILVSTSTNLLTIPSGSDLDKTYEGSDTSFVTGPVKKIGNSGFKFPLGDTTLATGAYHPLSITAPISATDAYTASYYAQNQTYGSGLQTDSLESISNCEYFTLNRDAGTSVVIPTISWNSNNCNVGNYNDLRVAYWDSGASQWKSLGISQGTINQNLGTATAAYGQNVTALPLVIGKFKVIEEYPIVKRELDGGYYQAFNGKLNFKYDEEYADVDGKLKFNIYNSKNEIVATNLLMPLGLQPNVVHGDNRYTLNVLSCSFTSTGRLGTGFYVLEVVNEKNEKRYLRFKNSFNIFSAPACPATGVLGFDE